MNRTVNIYWTRHALSCSNVLSAYSLQQTNQETYKKYKSELLKDSNDYRNDTMLTEQGKAHIQKFAKEFNIKIDKIITSNLIRSIETGYILSNSLKHCKDKTLYILPYINENGSIANGKSARTISELKSYIYKKSFPTNMLINKDLYKSYPDISKFRKILNKLISKSKKSELNLLIVSHGGFISENITGSKLANLETWKQTHIYKNGTVQIGNPILVKKGVGIKRDATYYSDPLNFGVTNGEFKNSVNTCMGV